MNKHFRIIDRLFNTPLLIAQDKLDIISSNIGLKLLSNSQLDSGSFKPTDKQVASGGKTAIIQVFDSLVSKGGAGASGFTTYETITSQINSAINAGFSNIGFYIDSPGGEASGAFALTDFIASLPTKYGITTFSFTDGIAASGAYAIAAATQKIYATDSSTVGSIGAIMSLVDLTEADKQDGVSYTIIRSVSEKAIYNPHETMSKETLSVLTDKLNAIGDLFSTKVTDYRSSLTLDNIKTFNGKTYMGQEALSLGLVDQIVSSIDEVFTIETNAINSNQPTTKGNIMTLEELKAQVSAKDAELATLQASVTNIAAKAITDERARILDIIQMSASLKISNELMIKRISAGTSVEDARDVFTAIADALGKATMIEVSENLPSTITDTMVTQSAKIDYDGQQVAVADILKFAKGVK